MSQITAVSFLFSALALLLINSKISQFFSIPTATLALLALIGYLFAFESLYRLPGYGSVAIHTAFTFLIVAFGILIARPTQGIMRVLSSNMPGSRVIRLLIPITILITISLAYIVEQSERASYFNAENALTIFVVLLILVYAPLFYLFAKRINQSEQRIMYGNRLYAILSQVNQTIVRVKSRQELFESICKIAVEFGEFRLAWIGLFDSETGQVTPVAEHGYGQNKLPFHDINTGEMPFREGLIGEALQTAEITFSNDIQTDPDMKHWYEAAVQGDYHSAVAVPIRQGGRITGLLNLYAADVGFFLLKEEQSLLTEMGLDISFALDTMQAEAERGEVQERFEKVFQNSPLATVLASIKDGKYLDVNDAFLKLTGFSREEVIGRTSLDLNLIHPEDRAKIIEQLRQAGAFKGGEARIQTKAGEVRHVRIFAQEISIGAEKFFLSMNEDITEHKQAEEQNRFLANLVASVSDAIIAVDLQQNIKSWNAGAETMYGWKEEEVLGRPAKDILQTDFLEATREEVTKRIMEEGYWKGEVLQLSRNGTRIPSWSSTSLYKDAKGNPTGIVAVNRDITERKQTEDALRVSESHKASLLRLSRELEQAQTFQQVLDAALKEIKEVLGYQTAWAYLLSEDGETLKLITIQGELSEELSREFPTLQVRGDRFLEEIVAANGPVVV